jgi:hypothetical protein
MPNVLAVRDEKHDSAHMSLGEKRRREGPAGIESTSRQFVIVRPFIWQNRLRKKADTALESGIAVFNRTCRAEMSKIEIRLATGTQDRIDGS